MAAPPNPPAPAPLYPRLFISAVRKSSGKTLLSLGLAGALRARGHSVRLYKKGPDYIDPMWHKEATGQDAYNLDEYLCGEAACRESFLRHSLDQDISLIEGNLGLHDGLELDGRYSSADLAKHLHAPVLVVVDASGMNRNVAAVVHGMMHFDPEVRVAGVVLNRVRSERQAGKQVQAIEHYCGIPVLGAFPVQGEELILERHLGLITPHEDPTVTGVLETMRELAAAHVDLERVVALARSAPPLPEPSGTEGAAFGDAEAVDVRAGDADVGTPVRIGLAWDPAFCFYYRDNLEALERAGAELVPFDCLKDPRLPDVDAVYLAGGFPESFLEGLEANASLRRELKEKIEGGLPAYAECGGMMYLARSITREGETREMVGVIPADVQFQRRPVGYGYVDLAPGEDTGWLRLERPIRGHEFHYSRLRDTAPGLRHAYRVTRGEGMGDGRDGIVIHNLLASYCHLHAGSIPEWSRDFTAAARKYRQGKP